MTEFRFILDGQLLEDHPEGADQFTEALVRDEELHGLTLVYEADLTFVGDGYKILEDKLIESNCAEVVLIVEQQCSDGQFEQELELLVKITDIDTNLNKCKAQAKVTDNSYYGMIHNNKKIAVPMNATLSKNGVEIEPCPTISYKVFLPNLDGSGDIDYIATDRVGYAFKDALAFVLRYITDNRITTVQSEYLDSLNFTPDSEYFNVDTAYTGTQTGNYVFSSGYGIRVGGAGDEQKGIKISWDDIISTLFCGHNMFWIVSGQTLTIEPSNYFFSNENEDLLELLDQPDLVRSFDTSKLYSSVVFGSKPDLKDRELLYSMPFVDLISHQQQTYNLTGACNIESQLSLVDGLPYDSNVIEKIIVTEENASTPEEKDQQYDDNIFVVQVFKHDGGANADDLYYSAFSTYFLRPDAPNTDFGVIYNPGLLTSEIIKRHNVQSDFSFYVSDDDDNILVSQGSGQEYTNRDITGGASEPIEYYPDSDVSSLIESRLDLYFQYPGMPKLKEWGGLVNNSNADCESFVGCSPPALRLPCNAVGLDPNGNWDATDYLYQAPATGVYGFEVGARFNKLYDLHESNSGDSVPTNILVPSSYEIRLMRGRNFFVKLFFVVYDSADNFLYSQLIPPTDQFQFANEFPFIGGSYDPNAYVVQFDEQAPLTYWLGTNYGSTSGEAQQDIFNMCYDHSEGCVQTYPNDTFINDDALIYLQSGQKLGIMVSIKGPDHFPYLPIGPSRAVKYGLVPGSYLRTNFIISGGGEFEAVDPSLYRAFRYTFDRPLTKEEWDEIKNDPKKGIMISPTFENKIKTFPSNIKRNQSTGSTDFTLMGNRNQEHF